MERAGIRLKRMLPWTRATRVLIDLLLLPSDLVKIHRGFRQELGRRPRILFPRTLNDYLQHTKILRRRSRHVMFADKLAVRDFVAARIGAQHLNTVFWHGTDIREARGAALPNAFVIKSNNGSGSIIVVDDATSLDWDALHAETSGWLEWDQSRAFAEWQYRWIRPRLLVEERLAGPGGAVPTDWKFYCMHGRVAMVAINLNRMTNHTQLFLDRDFNPLPLTSKHPRHHGRVDPPRSLPRLIELAEALAEGEPFIRVDLYDLAEVRFGELTLHPNSGFSPFDPPEWDRRLGELVLHPQAAAPLRGEPARPTAEAHARS